MGIYEIIIGTMFIPFLFILSIFFSLTLRKRNMQKIISDEISDDLKDLKPREFFYNLLKMERTAKPVYCAEIFLLAIDTIYILFGGYAEYLKELKFAQEFPDFPINPMSFVFIKFGIPIFLWFIVLFLLLFALFMKKKENKRLAEMLDNLEKYRFLNYAKEDFINSEKIVKTGMVAQSDLKIGSRYLFSVYPAYIIPYSWISDIKIDRVYNRGGSYSSLTFIFTKSFKYEKIFFAKKEVAEKVRDFILKNEDFH